MRQTWKGDISTKERLMVTRQQQIEQVWHHEEESKIKDKSMQVGITSDLCHVILQYVPDIALYEKATW